ncbi:D-ribose pyranase [Litorihabitans aurantiacus]|uniref:D-ribose pyranase n=1 Tax=Litorihabitans aurantiacus TaxID=1930061 RepID=A0AA37XGG4_9MICO|nr:D-ribose pyranase [Litorihabitans aurantiacus]GMA32496.1 D-ribose pyranase [Litorihabitans aurantiacus]
MKRTGIINAPLSAAIARLGHTDLVVVADAGLPVPPHVPVVDLALVYGSPRFVDVLTALLGDVVAEHAWVSRESDAWPGGAWVDDALGFAAERVEHGALKAMVGEARLVVRTGEDVAYSNVVLRCGVPFAV